jgi:hypothetical protein
MDGFFFFWWDMKLQAICETKFHYRDKSPPMNYVVNISSNMQVLQSYLGHYVHAYLKISHHCMSAFIDFILFFQNLHVIGCLDM